jgi:hypothetical protein
MFFAARVDNASVGWLWVVGGLVAWVTLAGVTALVIGRGIRMADLRDLDTAAPRTTADLPASLVVPAVRTRRRAIPLPPVGVALAAVAVGLMAVGYVTALTGVSGTAASVLSMEAPLSLPRLFVAGLFAAAAVVAVAGAARNPDRRIWWLAVGLVAAGIASVKAGGDVHYRAMSTVAGAVGQPVAVALSAFLAVGAVGALWYLSRTERRDRRRVLGSLTGYAVASVGFSALSSALASTSLGVTSIFIEESGEALAGVAYLVAVLIGVAPQLALPAGWALRREADADAVELARPSARAAADPAP